MAASELLIRTSDPNGTPDAEVSVGTIPGCWRETPLSHLTRRVPLQTEIPERESAIELRFACPISVQIEAADGGSRTCLSSLESMSMIRFQCIGNVSTMALIRAFGWAASELARRCDLPTSDWKDTQATVSSTPPMNSQFQCGTKGFRGPRQTNAWIRPQIRTASGALTEPPPTPHPDVLSLLHPALLYPDGSTT